MFHMEQPVCVQNQDPYNCEIDMHGTKILYSTDSLWTDYPPQPIKPKGRPFLNQGSLPVPHQRIFPMRSAQKSVTYQSISTHILRELIL